MADLNATFADALFADWHMSDAVAKSLEVGAQQPSRWWMDVPQNARIATDQMAARQAQLLHDQREIEQAARRLATFVDAWQPGQPTAEKSLGLEPDTNASPESRLAAVLVTASEPQTKGLFDPLQAAQEEFERFVQRVRALISNYAEIETAAAGVAIGRTLVGWAGDFQTAWVNDLAVEQIGLHQQNVRLALARRAMLMTLLIIVSTGAAKIALRLSTPGAQLLVIPAVWQFMKDVIAQMQAIDVI